MDHLQGGEESIAMAQINLQKIVSVKGKAGLFLLLAYNPRGYYLQPLPGGKVVFIANKKDKVLALGNIDLKLKDGSVNLMEVFHKLGGQSIPAVLSDEQIRHLFNDTIPNLDNQQVAPSHLRKVLVWYVLLKEAFGLDEMVNTEDDGLKIV